MALGTGAYAGLATSEVWTLLVGRSPSAWLDASSNQIISALGALVMAMPAWILFGVSGVIVLHVCRARRQRRRRFATVH